ncbi:hypothetical protein ACE02G_15720 [Shewanella xiamenensis]|uniref:hypothetical protein n=1 Tax=Shewanella xiamenensis TaxID=332186 RepID=UPI001558AA4A|nr:hypothetical protein [Shewanella xiamenensis]
MSGLDDYNTPAKLLAFFQTLLQENQLPTRQGKIARSLIEKTYGFKHGSLTNYYQLQKYRWCKQVLDDFEQEIKELNGGILTQIHHAYGTPEKFKHLLNHLKNNFDELPVSKSAKRPGCISRRTFEKKFNFPAGSMSGRMSSWHWAYELFEQFEIELYEEGNIGTVWEKKVLEIRNYLEVLTRTNTLPINGLGKLNKKAVLTAFGLGNSFSTSVVEMRSRKLRSLFEEYDQIVQSHGYSQFSADRCIDELKRILATTELVLDSSSRKISLNWLAKLLGVTAGMIRNSPNLMALINERIKALHESQSRGLTKKSFTVYGAEHINVGAMPYSEKHGRVYSFASLIKLYGLEFCEKVATCFIAITNKDVVSTVKNKYLRLLDFFEWLADSRNLNGSIASALGDNTTINDAEFGRACMAYRAHLTQPHSNSNLNLYVITQLGEARIIPKFKFLIQARKHQDKGHRKSILEASINKDEQSRLENILTDAAKYRGIEISNGKDTKAFLETLLFEKLRNPNLSDDLVESMLEITNIRLAEIRIQASKAFREWLILYERGKELLMLATVDCEEFRSKMDNRRYISSYKWSQYVAKVFPSHEPEVMLANLLSVINNLYKGCPPTTAITNMHMWNKKYQLVGGVEKVASYLVPTRRALSAALILYLCESGANVAVATTLAPDCVQNSSVPLHKKIVGRKDRANGKVIYDDLPIRADGEDYVSAVQALEGICAVQWSIGNDVLKYYMQGTMNPLAEYAFRADFKAICSQSDYLKQFRLVPSMLRPTVLLNIQLKDPANLGIAQLIAQHESGTTTQGYTNKLPHRLQMERDILEFQKTLEIAMVSEDENAPVKLGIEPITWNEHRAKMQKTGWGVFCKDREITDVEGQSVQCTEVEHCVKCKHDRMLVSADPESISEMMIWKTVLERHEERMSATNMERWTNVWVPWQAFFYVVLEEKMTRGVLSSIKRKAEDIVKNKIADTRFVMPEPW